MNTTSIIVALIGAATGITGAIFTAQATSSSNTAEIDTKVQVLEERQARQYEEVKDSLERIEKKLDMLSH